MSRPRQSLIDDLVAGATPVARPGRTHLRALGWLALATGLSIGLMALRGPFQMFRVDALLESRQFLVETALGLLAVIVPGLLAFRSAIPSAARPRSYLVPAILLFMAWTALLVLGLWQPALEPSMAGKRPHCWVETFVVGMPGLVIGCMLARRLWPLHGAWTGLMLGLASGALPALAMQFVCMYDPYHDLQQHVLPAAVLGITGWFMGRILLRPRGA